jgi:hypothetical protein
MLDFSFGRIISTGSFNFKSAEERLRRRSTRIPQWGCKKKDNVKSFRREIDGLVLQSRQRAVVTC